MKIDSKWLVLCLLWGCRDVGDDGQESTPMPPAIDVSGVWDTGLDGIATQVTFTQTKDGDVGGVLVRHIGNDYTTDSDPVTGTMAGLVLSGRYDKNDVKLTFDAKNLHFSGTWGGISWTGTRHDTDSMNACGCRVNLRNCSGTLPEGAKCTENSQCCTGWCGSEGTCLTWVGGSCSSSSQCASGSCAGGKCCSTKYSACDVDSDCCAGLSCIDSLCG